MRSVLRIVLLVIFFLMVVLASRAETVRMCDTTGEICREVEVGALVRDFAQDINRDPPKDIRRHRVADWKWWTANIVSVGTSAAATYYLWRCREDHGIGPCTDGGYGPFKAREILRQGQTGAFIGISWKIKEIEDNQGSHYKFWWLFPVGNAAYNAGVMIENARKNYGPKEVD